MKLKQLQKAKAAKVQVLPVLANSEGLPPIRLALEECDLFGGCPLGTGLSRPLEGIFRETVQLARSLLKPVVAVDIPFGHVRGFGMPPGGSAASPADRHLWTAQGWFFRPPRLLAVGKGQSRRHRFSPGTIKRSDSSDNGINRIGHGPKSPARLRRKYPQGNPRARSGRGGSHGFDRRRGPMRLWGPADRDRVGHRGLPGKS